MNVNHFVQMLQTWQPFYTTIATSSATLMGLLFVSLSLNRQRLDDRGRMAARRTFGSLIDVLVLALIFLIPHEHPFSLAIALSTFGIMRLLTTVFEAVQLAKGKAGMTFIRSCGSHTGMQLVLSSSVAALGIAVFRQSESALFWPVTIVVALLGSASWNAWELLFKD